MQGSPASSPEGSMFSLDQNMGSFWHVLAVSNLKQQPPKREPDCTFENVRRGWNLGHLTRWARHLRQSGPRGVLLEQEAEVRSDILSEGNSFRAPQRFFPPRPPPHKDFGAGAKAEVGLSLKHNSPTLFLLYPQKAIKSQSYWGGPGKSKGS